MAAIAEEADDEIQYMKESLKHEIQANLAGISDEQRREDLRQQSRTIVKELKDRLDSKFDKESIRKKNRTEEQIGQLKKDQQALHEREIQTVKSRFEQKLVIERQRIASLNNQLLEESGDIDQQVKLFSQNLLSNKIEEEKNRLESDHLIRLKDIRDQQRDEH